MKYACLTAWKFIYSFLQSTLLPFQISLCNVFPLDVKLNISMVQVKSPLAVLPIGLKSKNQSRNSIASGTAYMLIWRHNNSRVSAWLNSCKQQLLLQIINTRVNTVKPRSSLFRWKVLHNCGGLSIIVLRIRERSVQKTLLKLAFGKLGNFKSGGEIF